MEVITSPARTRRPLGYGLVALTALLLGVIGTIPFVILGYAVVQWVLAPLGLARADSSNNDGAMVLVISGVVVPLVIAAVWAATVRWLIRRFVLPGRVVWPMAFAALLLPVVVFTVSKSV